VFPQLLAGIAGLDSSIGLDVCLLWVLCVAQGDVSVMCRSLIQGNPPKCDLEQCFSTAGPWPGAYTGPQEVLLEFVILVF